MSDNRAPIQARAPVRAKVKPSQLSKTLVKSDDNYTARHFLSDGSDKRATERPNEALSKTHN